MSLKMLLSRASLAAVLVGAPLMAAEPYMKDENKPSGEYATKEEVTLLKRALIQVAKDNQALAAQIAELQKGLSNSGVAINLETAKIKDEFNKGKKIVAVVAKSNTAYRNAPSSKGAKLSTLKKGEIAFVQGYVDEGKETYFRASSDLYLVGSYVALAKEK